MGRVHPWVELGRVGSGHKILRLEWVGLGRDSDRRVHLYARNSSTIIPNDNCHFYYRLLIYSSLVIWSLSLPYVVNNN